MLKSNNTCRNHPNLTRLLNTEVYDRRRSMKGMSQYVLAEKAGLTRNCICDMECYKRLPKLETILDIMAALGFSKAEQKVFAGKYVDAYYADKEFQEEQEKVLVGAV